MLCGSLDYDRTVFQPTLPARGATLCVAQHFHRADISTHAPRTGSDPAASQSTPAASNFNPRSPHGERHALEFLVHHGADFNPRSPHGERRIPPEVPAPGERISIHAPRTGSDDRPVRLRQLPHISIHAPRTGSDSSIVSSRFPGLQISIHAPRTGSDTARTPAITMTILFQSTLPARGATLLAAQAHAGRNDFNPRSPHGERRRCRPHR